MAKPKLSIQTKSFIILFSIAIFGTYLCLMLWADLNYQAFPGYSEINYPQTTIKSQSQNSNQISQMVIPNIDTSTWKTFVDKVHNLTFSYNPSWKVLPPTKKSGFTILQVDPGKKFYNIKIYISPSQYYVMGGLPTKTETIGGVPGLNVNNALYGVQANGFFYTFDVGLSMSLVPQFDALVHSVNFGS